MPALVGRSVTVVVPAEATSCTDRFSGDPPAGRTTSRPAPAHRTFTRSVPVAGVGRPLRGDPEPAARVDVLDQDGAGLGAVRLPQLRAVDAVVGGEEQRPPTAVSVGRVAAVVAVAG